MSSREQKDLPKLPLGSSNSETLLKIPDIDPNRRESGVFLSPTTSDDKDKTVFPSGVTESSRQQLDSGYLTGISVSSSVYPEYGASPNTVAFYIEGENSQIEDNESPETVLLDSGAHSDPLHEHDNDNENQTDQELDDDFELPSARTLNPYPHLTSTPIQIPQVPHSRYFQDHGATLRAMDATPPRTYITHPTPCFSPHGSHKCYSTGCLTGLSPLMVRILSGMADTAKGELIEKGIRAASGHLHSSSSRAELSYTGRRNSNAQQHGVDFSNTASQPNQPIVHRDRSLSAPNIGAVIVQRQCAKELRKISDEFFEEFPRKGCKKAVPRTQSQSSHRHAIVDNIESNPLPSSFPGSTRRSHSSWSWQAIIQSLSPNRVRAPTLPQHQEFPDIETIS